MNISSAFRLASTACGVGLIGDAMAQQIERHKKGKEPLSIEEWDAARAGRIVVYRAVQAPIVDSAWRSFDLLATRLSLTSLRAVAFRVPDEHLPSERMWESFLGKILTKGHFVQT